MRTTVSAEPAGTTVARFVAAARLPELPATCVRLARRGILDAVGCGLYGATLQHAGWVREQVATLPAGPGAVSLWGHRGRARAEDAALVNGAAVHATEMSETFIRAVVHPGNVIVPAAVAVAEELGRSGEELLTAVVTAYEVLVRCGLTAGVGALMEQRLHTFSLLGVFGSAVAAAKLRFGDDAAAIGHALGIVASLAPTALFDAAREGASIKDLFEGQAASVGVTAARYAAAGVTGVERWAEEWFTGVVRHPDLPRLTDGLGHRWEMASGGLRIKLRPVMGLVQPTIAAVLNLLDRHDVEPGDIREIRVDSTKRAVIAGETAPASVTGAKASIPFAVAALLIHRDAVRRDPFLLDFYTPELLADTDVLEIASRCQVVVDDEFEHNFESAEVMKYESRVTIRLRGGATVRGYADIWPATSRLSFEEVTAKFRACAGRGWAASRTDEIIDMVRELESLPDVRSLGELLSAHRSEAARI